MHLIRPHLLLTRSCLVLLALVFLLGTLPGCATRTVRHSVVRQNLIEMDLVREVEIFSLVEQDFEHPAIISVPRLMNILNAIEVEMQADKTGVIRQPAFQSFTIQMVMAKWETRR